MTQTVLLKEAMELVTDYVANGSFASLKQNVYYRSEPSYAVLLRLVDYNAGYKNDKVWVDEDSYKFLKKSSVLPGDIIIANVGANAGTVFRAPDLGVPMTLGPNSVLLRSKKSNDYFYYWLSSPDGQAALKGILSGSAQPKFNKTDLRALKVPDPDIETQKKIANVLGTIDEKIELNRKMNETLEQMGQALFRHYFVTNPEAGNWGKIPIGKKIHPRRGRSLQSRNMISGEIPVISGGLKPAGLHNESNTQAPVITVSASGANAGFVALWETPVWSADSSYIDASITDDVYFYYLFMKANQTNIYGMQTGSGQPHIYPKHIELLEIPNAPNELLKEFHDQVESMFKKIHENDREIENLTALRDTILPKLISGKIKL